MQLKLGQRLTEVILTGQTKTMHCTVTILPQKHLVEIGFENFFLVVMQLQQYCHQCFIEFSAQAALIAQKKFFTNC